MVYYLSHPAILHTLCTKHPETCHFHLFSVSPPPNSESRPIVSAFGTLSPVQGRTTSWNARHCLLTVPAIIRPNLIIASSIDSYPSSNYSNESSSNLPYDSTLLLATAAVAVAHPYIPSSSAHHNLSPDPHSRHSIFTLHPPSFMCNHIRFPAPTLLRHRNPLNRGPLSSMAADAGLYPHRLDTFGALFFSPPLLVPNPRLGTSGLGPGRRCRPRVRITSIVPFPDWSRPTPCVHCCLPRDVGAIRASYLCLRRAPCPVPAPRSQLAYCVPRVVYRCPLVCIYDMPSGSWFTGTG